tara:strand:+ start:255 stop:821 length:567 start_codon:yes stop_codon:yes gene_type:complete
MLGNWENALLAAHRELIENKNSREVGKIRQQANEHLQQEWINKNTNLNVLRRTDLPEDSEFLSDHNESGWDMVCKKSGLRIQSKYRGGQTIHMEQTRRVSKKNKGSASSSGHVVYTNDEFDVLVVTRPAQYRMECGKEDFIVMPVSAVEDPKNPGFLYKNVPKSVWSIWQNRDPVEVLNQLLSERGTK